MRSRSMRHRTTAAVLAATGLALLATGCRDDLADGGGNGNDPSAKPSASASKPSDKPVDKPVDSDIDKTLPLGEATRIGYQRGSDPRIVLQLAATSVKKGEEGDLDTVRLDASERAMQPYYVTMDFRNDGDKTLQYPFLSTPVHLRDSRGEESKHLITIEDDVPACADHAPKTFPTGAKATVCTVFLLPKGEKPSVVTYTGDYEKGSVFWKAS